ncbi:uncharacterized protein LOC129588767 [Paramacrobiotus metropolitanus]|uniref:uncharacterized protein LOC129588767 n=1 Tax=Paramacrobiotus metropolitanus TaxID=2943436 RepID=UPI0024460E4B|nr:uncharacterized protein LOC129588767 [Paramacrobiotus metropolitanus]
MFWVPLLLWTFALPTGFCVPTWADETCDGLGTICRSLRDDFRMSDREIMRTGWPVTEEEANQRAQPAETFCRLARETGHCMNSLNERCPEHRLSKDENGWFMAAWNTFNARLCNSSVGPQRFLPAAMECYFHNSQIVNKTLSLNDSPYLQANSASIAHRNACSMLSDTVAQLNGTARAAITAKCGEEGARVMLEGAAFLYQANCQNPTTAD